jgi:hypothetical protein
MTPPARTPGRPRPHSPRGPSVPVACRFKAPDRARVERAAADSGLTLSDWLRTLALDALDAAPEPARGGLWKPAAVAG